MADVLPTVAASTQEPPTDTPQSMVARARTMLQEKRAPMTAENLNRAMQMITQSADAPTDFSAMVEQQSNPTASRGTANPAVQSNRLRSMNGEQVGTGTNEELPLPPPAPPPPGDRSASMTPAASGASQRIPPQIAAMAAGDSSGGEGAGFLPRTQPQGQLEELLTPNASPPVDARAMLQGTSDRLRSGQLDPTEQGVMAAMMGGSRGMSMARPPVPVSAGAAAPTAAGIPNLGVTLAPRGQLASPQAQITGPGASGAAALPAPPATPALSGPAAQQAISGPPAQAQLPAPSGARQPSGNRDARAEMTRKMTEMFLRRGQKPQDAARNANREATRGGVHR